MQDVKTEPLEKGEDEDMEDVVEELLKEDEWRPGMKLNPSHPSWMWKQNRKDLASKEGRNKAGCSCSTLGKGKGVGGLLWGPLC